MAIYNRGRGFRTRNDREQIQQVDRAGHEPGTARLRVRRAAQSATMPPWNLFMRKWNLLRENGAKRSVETI